MDEGSLAEEIEILEAIYIEELDVQRNEKDEVFRIILQLHPATGEDLDQRFVCMTLILDLTPEYPNVPPEISIKNPRGIAEEELLSLREDMHKLCEDRKGGAVLFELIELAKDSLTAGNIPHCPCMICLEHFNEGEKFTKTECYHYFHEDCLSRFITHVLTKTPEIVPAHAEPAPEANKLVCPVCREKIHYKFDDFDTVLKEEDFVFTPTVELRKLQVKMAGVLERQKACGGIIDVEAERNKYLVKNDDVVLLALPKVEKKQKSDRLRSRESKFEEVDVEKLKELQSESDRNPKYQGEDGSDRSQKSDYRRGRGRGFKFNDRDTDRDRENRLKEEQKNKTDREKRMKKERKDRTMEGKDFDQNDGGRTKIEDDSYHKRKGQGAKRMQWKDEDTRDRNEKNRNYSRGQVKDRRNLIVGKDNELKETSGNESDCQTISSENSDITCRKENEVEELGEMKRAIQFGRPPEKELKDEVLHEETRKSDQNVGKQRRGGFGRPEKNRYRVENFTDDRARRSRGGFGKPGKGFKETSAANPETNGQNVENEKTKCDEKSESKSIEGSTETGEIIQEELENKDKRIRVAQGSADDQKFGNRNYKSRRGGFGRPSERRNDYREQSYNEVNISTDNFSRQRRGGFGKPEKKNYQDERYTDERPRKNRGGFGQPNKDFKEKSDNISRPGSGETTCRSDSKSDTCSPRIEDQSKDEDKQEKSTSDRHSRDSKHSGYWRGEDNRTYSREGKSYRDTGRNRYEGKHKYGDRNDKGYREYKSFRNSNNYHEKYDKQNRFKNEEGKTDSFESKSEGMNHYSGFREEANENERKTSGFQRSRGSGRYNGYSRNRTENNGSRNKSTLASNSEQGDTCTENTLKQFDKMSVSIDSSNTHERCVNSSENNKSEVCDSKGADKCEKKGGPPGFAVYPPPGFQRTDKTSTVVEPPPGFS